MSSYAAIRGPTPSLERPVAHEPGRAIADLTLRRLGLVGDWRRILRRVPIVALTIGLEIATPVSIAAHDWLTGKRGLDGRACCFATARNGREPDCHVVTARHVLNNWVVSSPVTNKTWWIPDDQAQTSEDNHFWLCQTPWDTKPRCFFVPKSGGSSEPGKPVW